MNFPPSEHRLFSSFQLFAPCHFLKFRCAAKLFPRLDTEAVKSESQVASFRMLHQVSRQLRQVPRHLFLHNRRPSSQILQPAVPAVE